MDNSVFYFLFYGIVFVSVLGVFFSFSISSTKGDSAITNSDKVKHRD